MRYSRFARDTPGGPFRSRAILLPILGLSAAALLAAGITAGIVALKASGKDSPFKMKKEIAAQWKAGEYEKAYGDCSRLLEDRPLDPFYLTFGGFSAFYLGSSQVSDEARLRYLRESVSRLRKALVLGNTRYPGEIRYILGKTYFHLGYFYLDESVRFLEEAKKTGYSAEDVDEYLAMAYYHLGNTEKAMAGFEEALKRSPTDELYVTAAMAMISGGNETKAEEYLSEAIAMTTDVAVGQKARFLLAEMYAKDKKFLDAEEQLSVVISEDPASAEARYQLGLLYESMGDQAKARSEWRKAIKADPMHQGARLKLN
jgi:tetratricopeptide (TPR) repeat protein